MHTFNDESQRAARKHDETAVGYERRQGQPGKDHGRGQTRYGAAPEAEQPQALLQGRWMPEQLSGA